MGKPSARFGSGGKLLFYLKIEGNVSMPKDKKEATKIFRDILVDYWDLKYIFEYGFYWDDKVTKAILHKGSQTVRELTNILADSVYKNCVCTSWWKNVGGEKVKKSSRLLVLKNHYRLMQNHWFLDLYGCYGKYDQPEASDYIKSCSQISYSLCRSESEGQTKTCTYRKICRIKEEKELFFRLSSGISLKDMDSWKDNILCREIEENYGDVIEKEWKGKTLFSVRLKKNLWTEEIIKGIITQKEKPDFSDNSSGNYKNWLNMIRFFSNFSPLSVLGENFLRHSIKNISSDNDFDFILIRNLPLDFGLEQEYLYRCLYAMVNQYSVLYEEKEYLPLRLEYREKDLFGIKKHLYLEAAEINNGEIGKVCFLPLFNGLYLEPGRKANKEDILPEHAFEDEKQIFQVDFYYSDEAPYLIERRKKGWKDELIDEKKLDCQYRMNSPYHPEIQIWDVDRASYQVKKEDIPGFFLFIRSFGDFARIKEKEPGQLPVNFSHSTITRGKIREAQSLLSLYHSTELIEKVNLLPPRKVELEWLYFILQHYPNMCQIFLDETSIQKIKQKILDEIKTLDGWFDEKYANFSSRVCDIKKGVVNKYKAILEAIEHHRVLTYEFEHKPVSIFPYALEYDVSNHLSSQDREPIDVMCYSLKEKRNIKILYRKIHVKESFSEEEIVFTDLDKLYHSLAYAIRCAVEGRTEIDRKTAELLECLWKPDPRGGDNYNRCVKKRWKKKENYDYEKELKRLEKTVQKNQSKEGMDFLTEVFYFWRNKTDAENKDLMDFQMQYQTFLLSCFTDGFQQLLSSKTKKKVKQCLKVIETADIWELIWGREKDGIVNEIAFYNEKLKHATVSFVLKKESEEEIDLVYQLFAGFVCAGELELDNRIRFTITYEKFYYRKIHMLLMALADKIEKIKPEQTRQIIQKRIQNMQEDE